MGYYNEDELYRYFDKAIRKASQKDLKKLQDEIDFIHQSALKRIKEEIRIRQSLETSRRLRELRVKYQEAINQIGIGYDAKLINERIEMSKAVFKAVADRIDLFAASEDYTGYLERRIGTLKGQYKEQDVTFRVKEGDTEAIRFLKTLPCGRCRIEETEDIRFGGFEMHIPALKQTVDMTLDAAFEEQKTWFYHNAKLFIRT
jgi:vacuolar-type H+-ATPase subunit E/Vma4